MNSGPKILRSYFLYLPLGARLAVNTYNMGARFVESVKNARWLMSPQEAGDGLESIAEFQVQIKGHHQRVYEDKWQRWQNWTDEKLATKLTKDDQQPVLLLIHDLQGNWMICKEVTRQC